MNFKITTPVKGNYKKVFKAFDRQLFEALAPPIARMEIVNFTGSSVGDEVHIRFLSPIKAEWISHITEEKLTASEAWFTDEGTQLPFPLKYWKHQHLVKKVDKYESLIIDNISYETQNKVLSILLYPIMYLAFRQRRKIYQSYFNQL